MTRDLFADASRNHGLAPIAERTRGRVRQLLQSPPDPLPGASAEGTLNSSLIGIVLGALQELELQMNFDQGRYTTEQIQELLADDAITLRIRDMPDAPPEE